MTIAHFGLVFDYFDEDKRHRVFACTLCGALIADRVLDSGAVLDGIQAHSEWHEAQRKATA